MVGASILLVGTFILISMAYIRLIKHIICTCFVVFCKFYKRPNWDFKSFLFISSINFGFAVEILCDIFLSILKSFSLWKSIPNIPFCFMLLLHRWWEVLDLYKELLIGLCKKRNIYARCQQKSKHLFE